MLRRARKQQFEVYVVESLRTAHRFAAGSVLETLQSRTATRRARVQGGLVRDKISTTEHVTTWFSAISAGCIVLFVVACLVINLVRHYGSWF